MDSRSFREDHGGEPPKFLVEQMLGKLVRMLRFRGFDTEIFMSRSLFRVIVSGQAEGRIVLSRSARTADICRRWELRMFSPDSDDPARQLQMVTRALHLDAWKLPTRCLRCNTVLEITTPEAARNAVPDYIASMHERFLFCPGCNTYFWSGSHADALRSWTETERPTRDAV